VEAGALLSTVAVALADTSSCSLVFWEQETTLLLSALAAPEG
jgi:hypothetical protein